jgi:hypothetical protein
MYQMLYATVNLDFLKTFTESSDGVIIQSVASKAQTPWSSRRRREAEEEAP